MCSFDEGTCTVYAYLKKVVAHCVGFSIFACVCSTTTSVAVLLHASLHLESNNVVLLEISNSWIENTNKHQTVCQLPSDVLIFSISKAFIQFIPYYTLIFLLCNTQHLKKFWFYFWNFSKLWKLLTKIVFPIRSESAQRNFN